MKNLLRSLLLLCNLISFSVSTFAFSYNITFIGSGAITTVDSVVVKNLNKGIQVKVPARFLLKLIDLGIVTVDIKLAANIALIYSKPEKTDLYIRSDEPGQINSIVVHPVRLPRQIPAVLHQSKKDRYECFGKLYVSFSHSHIFTEWKG